MANDNLDPSPATGLEPRPCYTIIPENDIAVIISVITFKGTTDEGVTLKERRGSKANVERLEDLVKKIGYTNVEKCENLEAAEIDKFVKNIVEKIKENSSSFVCFIQTHGNKGKIYGSDSQPIDVKKLANAFKNCKHLAGKPKLFFIEACGIHHNDEGYDSLNDSDFRLSLDPAEPHFLIAISLAPENVSFKNEKDGTWITDVFVKTFQNHYKEQDVLSMLVKVNKDASAEHAKNKHGGYKQPCQLVFTTTKIVKFPTTLGSDVEKHLKSDETEEQNEKVQSDRDDEYWSYPMKKQDNVAVIINVECFQKNNDDIVEFDHREGSNKDVEKLEQLWKNLGFNVKFPEDLKKENIFEFLKQVREDIVENSSCFVCCIMTHGHMGTLYGSDSEPLGISAIVDLFKGSNCEALAGKPKMFFIQACRSKLDKACTREASEAAEVSEPAEASELAEASEPAEASETLENGVYIIQQLDALSVPSENVLTQANPHEIDFFIGHSTLPDNKSYRNPESGTFYVNALVETFQEYHKDENLMSMMTRVNKKLVENEHCEQCPAPVLSLTRKVYFPSNA